MRSGSKQTQTLSDSAHEVPRGVRLIETEGRRAVTRGWERGSGELVSVWGDGKFLELDGGDGGTAT